MKLILNYQKKDLAKIVTEIKNRYPVKKIVIVHFRKSKTQRMQSFCSYVLATP